jgi:protease-4
MEIQGPIYDSDETVRRIRRFRKSSHKVLLLRLNTPGGGVAPSQEIYTEIKRARDLDKKIVVASISSLAASGGYYVAAACDKIVSNPGSLTGSIGVIASWPEASGLMKKLGLRFETIKSGEFKDTGSPDRPLTEAERAYMQSTINDVFDQFVQDVVKSRMEAFRKHLAATLHKAPAKVTQEEILAHVRRWADGRVLTGRKAMQEGFVDQMGNYYDAVDLAAKLGGVKGEPVIRRDRSARWDDLLDSMWPGAASVRRFGGWRLDYKAF